MSRSASTGNTLEALRELCVTEYDHYSSVSFILGGWSKFLSEFSVLDVPTERMMRRMKMIFGLLSSRTGLCNSQASDWTLDSSTILVGRLGEIVQRLNFFSFTPNRIENCPAFHELPMADVYRALARKQLLARIDRSLFFAERTAGHYRSSKDQFHLEH